MTSGAFTLTIRFENPPSEVELNRIINRMLDVVTDRELPVHIRWSGHFENRESFYVDETAL